MPGDTDRPERLVPRMFMLTPAQVERLKMLAGTHGRTMSALVREAIDLLFDKLDGKRKLP